MYRYIPAIPNPSRFTWSEIEIIGNYCMVKVNCSEAMHLQMQADKDFVLLPEIFTINDTEKIKAKMGFLGYEPFEIQQAVDRATLLPVFPSGGRQQVKANDTKTDVQLVPGRILFGKTLDQQDKEL